MKIMTKLWCDNNYVKNALTDPNDSLLKGRVRFIRIIVCQPLCW